MNFTFFFNSILLGIGLSMDAFSVSLANGLHETNIKNTKLFGIAGVFAFFQGLMPMLGWICIHTIVSYFKQFQKFIPWIALFLLLYIGIKMIYENLRCKDKNCDASGVTLSSLIVQGIATSIDALSVGFTIADYNLKSAIITSLIISAVTFVICSIGVIIGKKAGSILAEKAEIFGGAILIFIGIEIFVTALIK